MQRNVAILILVFATPLVCARRQRQVELSTDEKNAVSVMKPTTSLIPHQGSLANFYQSGRAGPEGAVHFASGRSPGSDVAPYDKEAYEEDWQSEYSHKEYPKKAEGRCTTPTTTSRRSLLPPL